MQVPSLATHGTRLLVFANALFAVVLAGCDPAGESTGPGLLAGPDIDQVQMAQMAKRDVCHRTEAGDFVKISVADAAFETHVGHGDLAVALSGSCPGIATTQRLDLSVVCAMYDSCEGVFVQVSVGVYPGEPLQRMEDCAPGETCSYDVLMGAPVVLTSPGLYLYCDPSCTLSMDRNHEVSATLTQW